MGRGDPAVDQLGCTAAGVVGRRQCDDVVDERGVRSSALGWDGGAVQLTRYSQSCIRLEQAGRVLVVDPGIWSEPQAFVGADAVLLTHDHPDHADLVRLAGLGAPVFAPIEANLSELDAHRVRAGSEFVAAGFAVQAVGGEHARVLPDQPLGANLGYVVEETLYHPGDALHVPHQRVETLMVPMQASWLKTSEAVGFLRAMGPRLALGVHDAQVNDRGLASVNGWLRGAGGTDYRWLAPGTVLPDLP